MKTLRRLALVGALSSLAAGCGTTEPSLPNIVGNWLATKFEFVSVANSSTRVDKTTQGTITMVITATAFSISGGPAGQAPQVFFSGTYTEAATTLAISGTDQGGHAETLTFAMALSGSTLSLTGATTNYDFGSGDVPAYVNLIWTKQ